MKELDEIEYILKHYREFADMAWSEVTDKVHTVEEYHEALEKITKNHTREIARLIKETLQECIGEMEELGVDMPPYVEHYDYGKRKQRNQLRQEALKILEEKLTTDND